jgi:hypothetical protein
VTGPADGRRRWRSVSATEAVRLGLARRLATLMETALAAERDSMHSPEHVAIVAKLIATSSEAPAGRRLRYLRTHLGAHSRKRLIDILPRLRAGDSSYPRPAKEASS